MREGRVTRRAAVVEEAPAETAQEEMGARPAETGAETLARETVDQRL